MRVAIYSFFVLLIACGGDDGPPGSISGDGCEECGEFETVLESICGGIDRCPDFVYPIGYRSQGECVAILAWATTCLVDDDGQDVDEAAPETLVRRIPELSEGQAQACSDYIDGASCDELNALMQGRSEGTPCVNLGNAGDALTGSGDDDDGDEPVSDPYVGKSLGEACNGGNEDCKTELYCHSATEVIEGTDTYGCSICRVRPKLGEPCRPFYEPCIKGLRCLQQEGMTGYDYYGVCAELGENGEACGMGDECKSQFCDRHDPSSLDKTCQDGGREGDPCGSAGRCVQEFVCVGPDDARICTAVKQNGEDCTYPQECSSRECAPDGKCGLPVGSDQRCNRNEDCRSSYCNRMTNQCADTVEHGEPCADDAQCGDGVCGRSSNTCVEDFCQNDADCADTQYCSGSYAECIERRSEGANCFSDEECLSNYCNSDERCGPETPMGGACQSNSQCYPWGACEGGMCVPLKDPGQACTGLQSCKPPFICQNGRCELINISCVPAKVGEPCASLRVCEAKATCDVVNGIVCKPRGGQGDSCIRPTDCDLEFYCARSRTCEPRPTEGEACESGDMPCAPGNNCLYDEQTSESTCVAAPVGDFCDSQTPCPEGFRCESGRCAPPLDVGDPCNAYDVDECPDGSHCSEETSVCAANPSKGAACDRNIPCADGFHCNETLLECVDDLENGTPCDYPGSECVDGSGCVPDEPGNGQGPKTCATLKSHGESCLSSLECEGICLKTCNGEGCLTAVCVESMCVPPEEVEP